MRGPSAAALCWFLRSGMYAKTWHCSHGNSLRRYPISTCQYLLGKQLTPLLTPLQSCSCATTSSPYASFVGLRPRALRRIGTANVRLELEVAPRTKRKATGDHEPASVCRTARRAPTNRSISTSPMAAETHPTPRGSIRTPSLNRPRKTRCLRSASAPIVSR